MEMPSPPPRSFASDNAAGAHPDVIEAVLRANHGHALAYGDDDHTRECERRFSELFGRDVATYLTFNGTGGNIVALTALARPGDAVVCTDWAHINVDETGAPERVVGTKLIDVPTTDAKLTPEAIEHQVHAIGVPHHAQPAIVSLTQSTELGTVYTADEVAAICDIAHRHGMRVHMDGARIANAVAACGGTVAVLRALTVDAGVDVITFGGTKNGMLGGEAVVFLDPTLGARGHFVRKTVTQLPSKMRFVAAQFNALIEGDLWIRLAAHANAMATDLHLDRGRRARRSPGGQQPVPVAPRRRDRPVAGVVLLLGLGPLAPAGALDDGLGHHGGRRRVLRRGGPHDACTAQLTARSPGRIVPDVVRGALQPG
jgi:threonine aldolase